jgi:hypothetical protein
MSPDLRRATLCGAGLAALWLAVAFLNRGTVYHLYHLAPLLVAAVVPIGFALSRDPGARSAALIAAATGTGMALAATVLLAATGRLEGGSLLPSGGAVAEAVLLSLAGGAVGLVLGLRRPR